LPFSFLFSFRWMWFFHSSFSSSKFLAVYPGFFLLSILTLSSPFWHFVFLSFCFLFDLYLPSQYAKWCFVYLSVFGSTSLLFLLACEGFLSVHSFFFLLFFISHCFFLFWYWYGLSLICFSLNYFLFSFSFNACTR